MDNIIRTIFENIPIINLLNGHKRKIGNLLIVTSGVLGIAQALYPEVPAIAQLIGYVGFATRILGDIHAQAKTE